MGVGVTDIAAASADQPVGRDGPSVLASAATGIVNFIERQRGDVDRIFGHAGISPEMAGSPTLQLSLGSYCRLFEESARETRNDNFGLWFGNSFDPRDLGLWGYAALSAPTLGCALETLVDLFPLHQQSSFMSLGKTPEGLVRLEYRIEAPQIIERRQDAELVARDVFQSHSRGAGAKLVAGRSSFRASQARGMARARTRFRCSGVLLTANECDRVSAAGAELCHAGCRPSPYVGDAALSAAPIGAQ